MNCDVCSREHSSTLPFLCVACARGTTYLARLESVRTLLDKERLGRQVEAVVKNESQRSPTLHASSSTVALGHVWSGAIRKGLKAQSESKVQSIETHLKELREEIEDAKNEVSARRAKMTAQKADLESVKASLPDRRKSGVEKTSESISKGSRTFDSLHKRTSETRSFLCQEAALLLRFKQKKRRKDGIVKDQYYISGLPVADLKDISGLRCAELSASFSGIAHLLNLASFYLSVRLPAEITVPHHDYPLPTIFTPANSYLNPNPPFPGTSLAHSTTNALAASKQGDSQTMPRARPLFIIGEDEDEKVVHVAKKNPAAFAFLVEGLSLLAWDVAWLCRSQGLTSGTETWEDVCNVGRNLWQLFLAPAQPSALMRVLSSRDVQERQKGGKDSQPVSNGKQKSSVKVGEHSHSSAHSFLGAHDAQDVFRSWKLGKHTLIADALKKALLADMNNAEWELLQEQEWDDGGEQFDQNETVFIKTRLLDGHEYDDARNIMTARPGHSEPAAGAGDGDVAKARGTSGWTKVKSREK